MTFLRVACLSCPRPTVSMLDVLDVCRGYPTRRTLSGIAGKLLCLGDQFVLLLEGRPESVEGLVARIQRDVPDAGLTARVRAEAEERAFTTLAIEDLYLDEVSRRDPDAADQLGDLVIDLFAGEEGGDNQAAFSSAARLSDRVAPRQAGAPLLIAPPTIDAPVPEGLASSPAARRPVTALAAATAASIVDALPLTTAPDDWAI